MKKLLMAILLTISTQVIFAEERTLDERCDGHSKYVMELLENKYKGETLKEQLELVDEWDDREYREEIKRILTNLIYTLPKEYTEQGIKFQALATYTAAYRSCIKKYS
ncbi:hypothetical protein BEN71_07050 [Acinetobacter wuhouensis]|uniref:hypothetical protein n=1 Tax=Acinetobacter wuhouensis TaxID=1879050 RepID=UPI000A32EF3B|nr:hypothetical protein [Acinetobacter wuhouensis]AXQ21834.1 hypothetical protein BEN71_07050 [Acinetobacter wuhouensis]